MTREADVDTHADAATASRLHAVLEGQRAAHLEQGPLSAERRINWLDRLIGLMVDYKDHITIALCADFGNRSVEASLLADVFSFIESLKHAKNNLHEWMRPVTATAPFPDAVAVVEYQPLGVVGLMSPWNFPFNLTFAPLAGIISAGNRCIIKPCEFTPASSELIARMIASVFDETEIAVWTGSPFVVPAAMAKTAIQAMTMSLAVEWGPYGIRLNAVAPRPFPTEGAWEKLNPIPETSAGATQADQVPMRRFGKMHELQNLMIFLMVDGCDYLTGQTIAIDGAHHLAAPSTFARLANLTDDQWAQARERIKAASERDKQKRTVG